MSAKASTSARLDEMEKTLRVLTGLVRKLPQEPEKKLETHEKIEALHARIDAAETALGRELGIAIRRPRPKLTQIQGGRDAS